MVLAYFITAHGYGHGVRSADIINSLVEMDPTMDIHVVSDLPEPFLRNRMKAGRLTFHRGAYDVGMVQLDSIRVDVEATYRKVRELADNRDVLLADLDRLLARIGAEGVVADVPALPIAAAVRRDLPTVAVGNFAWDWIYQPFAERDARWIPLVEMFREDYRQTGLLLHLPFSEPMEVFPRRERLGLLAQPGVDRRMEMASVYDADPSAKWVLLSFTSLDWDDATARRAAKLPGTCLFSMEPLAWPGSGIIAVDREAFSFSDVMASVDGVISKPGYGLLSDCVVNGKPMLYTEREDFIEYPVLVAAIRRYICHAHIPSTELYAGCLGPFLEKLWKAPPPPEMLETGSARRAAECMVREMSRATP